MHTTRYCLFLILLILYCSATLAEQSIKQGKVIKNTPLYKQANIKSNAIIELKADDNVVIHKRQRAWYQVTTQKKSVYTGWINMLNVRFIGVSKRKGELGVAALLSSVQNDTSATTSTGIRGFDEKDLAKATANMEQVVLLDSYQVKQEEAIAFAKQGGLTSKKLASEQVTK